MHRFRFSLAISVALATGIALSRAAHAQQPEEELDLTAEPLPEPAEPTAEERRLQQALERQAELQASLEALQARLVALEEKSAEPEPEPAPPPRPWYEHLDLRVSGYLQTQAEFHQLSEDELSPDGRALNQNRFVVRRGRLRVDRYWKYAYTALEIDANTVRGPFLSLRRAEATLRLPHRDDPSTARDESADLPPYAALTAGLQEIPFGYELRQGNDRRLFVERTTGSLAFFRGEPDTGLRLWGGLGPLRYDVAVQNGVPVDDRPGAVTEVHNHRKTFVGRLGFDSGPSDTLQVSGGVSWLDGRGFHAGTPSTKAQLLWRDINQDGLVTLNELSANPGQANTPSATFSRWGANVDLEIAFRTPLGWTRLHGEATMASNLDRALYVADPISAGYDLRETVFVASLVQEITRYGLFGFRVDEYNPNTDLFESRRGLFLPLDASILTYSTVFGLQLSPLGRFVVQYDYVSDHLGRDDRGEPIDLPNDLWIARLQVEF